MGNIVGEGFDFRIRNQVNIRQLLQGRGNTELRKNKLLTVLNNNTAWVKLMSSVYIDKLTGVDGINNPTIKEFGRKGADIAKAFVLFNGTSKYEEANGSTIQRGGIDFTNTLGGYDNVYGIGGSADFGLNPMMGITGIDVKHKNRGSIRTATVTVKAFNKTQFEIIDVLYMRLGFTVLLEWGNSIYVNNDGDYIPDGGQTNSLITDWFTDNNYLSFLNKIRNQSLSSDGNYDAMLAKVSNYHWSFQKDGSYDITIDLVSMGDVIESLNAGKSPNGIDTNAPKGEESILGKRLEKAKNQNKWGEEFYAKYLSLANDRNSKSFKENIGYGKQIQYHFTPDYYTDRGITNPKHRGGFLYIKLGKILQLLEDKITLSIKGARILNFDYNYKDNIIGIVKTNIIPITDFSTAPLILPNGIVINQMSYDPFKCITLKKLAPYIKHGVADAMGNGKADENSKRMNNSMTYINNPGNNLLESLYSPITLQIPITGNDSEDFDVNIGGTDYGQIMNILVNAEFVLDVVDDKTNKETGELPLIDFLKGILQGINESLGGITELDVFIDETINEVKIIDTNPLPNLDNLLKLKGIQSTLTTFNLYGYNNTNNTSNFIHDFNLTTEITPALSTMITVAATSNKTVIGEDNTALSKINKGLTDRYKSDISEDISSVQNSSISVSLPTYPDRGTTLYKLQKDEWIKKYYFEPIKTSRIGDALLTPNLGGQGSSPINVIVGSIINNLFGDTRSAGFTKDQMTDEVFEGLAEIPNASWVPPGRKPIIISENFLSTADKDVKIYLAAAYGLDNYNVPGETSFWETIHNISMGVWNKENIDAFNNSFKEIYRKWNKLKDNLKKKDNPDFKSGFIPFNLSLTMDGLGGMKIYQKFNVDTNFMPSNYPANIEFLIKNIQHTVKDNKWITKLESFCVSKPGSDTPTTRTPNVTGPGLDLHSSITITSKYKSGTVKATYTATIDNGTPAEKEIVITFTDTLKNTDTATTQPVPLHVSIVIAKGNTSGESEGEFSDAVYGSIEQNSKKDFFTFSNDLQLGQKYYFKIGESEFESAVVLIPSGGGGTLKNPMYGGNGNNWGGSLEKLQSILPPGVWDPGSQKRPGVYTKSGNISDHANIELNSYGTDFSQFYSTDPTAKEKGTNFAITVAQNAGLNITSWDPYIDKVLNIQSGGYRVQIIWLSWKGGNHYNHVHVGVRKN